jgi:NitT/TauT family transport system ATP-binding protein
LRLVPGKASVAQDASVNLTVDERRNRAAVLAEQNRIFAAS